MGYVHHFMSERPENTDGYPRVSNSDAEPLVKLKKGFKSNTKSLYVMPMTVISSKHGVGSLYVVYSYGPHFPLAVFDHAAGKWWHNEDKYSATTSRHYWSIGARHLGEGVSTEFLRDLIDHGGVVNAVAARLDEACSTT